jgi:hypothetical protein
MRLLRGPDLSEQDEIRVAAEDLQNLMAQWMTDATEAGLGVVQNKTFKLTDFLNSPSAMLDGV